MVVVHTSVCELERLLEEPLLDQRLTQHGSAHSERIQKEALVQVSRRALLW